MLAISASELAAIQAEAVSATCDQSCSIYRATLAPDGYGSESDTWVHIQDVMVGIAQPTGGQMQNFDYKIGPLAAWQVHMPVGTNVEEADHLVLDGQTLVVQIVLAPRSYPALLTCLASAVE